MRHFPGYIFIVLILLLYSCSPSRKTARTSQPVSATPFYAIEYLNKYSSLAVSEMRRTGIPASITLAQGMLESDYGRSTLAILGNNHFGIKCHNDWQGERIFYDDNRRGECFRSYHSAEESYRDHSDFLVSGSRYSDLFRLSNTDYKSWARGLKEAGYATDPKYPDLLIKKINDYGLHAYDIGQVSSLVNKAPAATVPKQTSPQTSPSPVQKTADTVLVMPVQATADNGGAQPEAEMPIKVISLHTGRNIQETNNVQFVMAEGNDTYESLAEEFQLLSWEIRRYNDAPPGAQLQPGQVIYLQPKRNRAAEGNSIYVVKAGETMYYLSQKYAVRLSSLYKMNVMDEGTECVPGQKVRIR